jgi:hypothetical protein
MTKCPARCLCPTVCRCVHDAIVFLQQHRPDHNVLCACWYHAHALVKLPHVQSHDVELHLTSRNAEVAPEMLHPASTSCGCLSWQDKPHPRGYVALRTATPPSIDGRLAGPAWAAAPWSDEFLDIVGPTGPKPWGPARVKMLWDDEVCPNTLPGDKILMAWTLAAHSDTQQHRVLTHSRPAVRQPGLSASPHTHLHTHCCSSCRNACKALYIGARLEDGQLFANQTLHDSIVYHDNNFEVRPETRRAPSGARSYEGPLIESSCVDCCLRE